MNVLNVLVVAGLTKVMTVGKKQIQGYGVDKIALLNELGIVVCKFFKMKCISLWIRINGIHRIQHFGYVQVVN